MLTLQKLAADLLSSNAAFRRGQYQVLLCCQFWLQMVIIEINTLAHQMKWPTAPAAMTSNTEDSICARDRWPRLIDLQCARPDGGQMRDPITGVELDCLAVCAPVLEQCYKLQLRLQLYRHRHRHRHRRRHWREALKLSTERALT